jgi:hypothetical protein
VKYISVVKITLVIFINVQNEMNLKNREKAFSANGKKTGLAIHDSFYFELFVVRLYNIQYVLQRSVITSLFSETHWLGRRIFNCL